MKKTLKSIAFLNTKLNDKEIEILVSETHKYKYGEIEILVLETTNINMAFPKKGFKRKFMNIQYFQRSESLAKKDQ